MIGSFNWGMSFAPPIELVAQADAGRGINFSNIPIENATQFGTDTISGDLLDGWEVELYRGNTLLDVKRSDGSGRFVFRDVALLFGENNIILKFYGPQGQFRQESRPVNIGRGMAPEGKLWSRFSFTDQGENIFLGRNSQTRGPYRGIQGIRTNILWVIKKYHSYRICYFVYVDYPEETNSGESRLSDIVFWKQSEIGSNSR